MKKDALSSLRLFTVFFLAAMFLPRLVPQGLFGDGLLYASLARNLAEGKGSMWAPWFSSGYWLDFASGAPYFENPPLMIWLEAVFFRIIGAFRHQCLADRPDMGNSPARNGFSGQIRLVSFVALVPHHAGRVGKPQQYDG